MDYNFIMDQGVCGMAKCPYIKGVAELDSGKGRGGTGLGKEKG